MGLLAGRAFAQGEDAPVARAGEPFAYASPVGCPPRSEFVARVNARQSVRSTSDVDMGLNELLARVVVESSRTRGFLYFRDARIGSRKVNANTCDEVVTGLALIAGVSLDGPTSVPDAPELGGDGLGVDGQGYGGYSSEDAASPVRLEPTSEASGANVTPAATSKPSVAPNSVAQPTTVSVSSSRRGTNSDAAKIRETPRPEPVAARGEETLGDEPRATMSEAESRPLVSSALVVGFGAAGGVWTALERSEPRVDGFFELGERGNTWAARVGGFAAWGDASALSWSANWTAYGGRLEGCPFMGGRGWHLGVCALGELGAVLVRSSSSAGNAAFDRRLLWADAGIGLRVGSPQVWKVNVEAEVDAVVPLTRYTLTFEEPAATLAHVPTVALMLRLGFRMRPAAE